MRKCLENNRKFMSKGKNKGQKLYNKLVAKNIITLSIEWLILKEKEKIN